MNPGCLFCFSGDEIRGSQLHSRIISIRSHEFSRPQERFPRAFSWQFCWWTFLGWCFLLWSAIKVGPLWITWLLVFLFWFGVSLFVGFCVFCLLSCFCLGFALCWLFLLMFYPQVVLFQFCWDWLMWWQREENSWRRRPTKWKQHTNCRILQGVGGDSPNLPSCSLRLPNLSQESLGFTKLCTCLFVFRIRDFESASLEVLHKSTSFTGPASVPFQIEVNGMYLTSWRKLRLLEKLTSLHKQRYVRDCFLFFQTPILIVPKSNMICVVTAFTDFPPPSSSGKWRFS